MSSDWKRGMRMLERGLYVDDKDGALHIDAEEMLEAGGYVPSSEENKEMLLRFGRNLAYNMGAEFHECE